MGPWHHVGVTLEITLDKNWIIVVIRRELNPITCNKIRMGVLGLAPCHVDQKITLQVRLVRFHSNLDGSSLAHAIQVPLGPLRNLEVLHLFRWFTHTKEQAKT